MKSYMSFLAATLMSAISQRFKPDTPQFERALKQRRHRIQAEAHKIENRRKHVSLHPKQIDRRAGMLGQRPLRRAS